MPRTFLLFHNFAFQPLCFGAVSRRAMPNVQTQSTYSVYPWTNEGHTHHIRMNQNDELNIIVSDTSFVTHLHIATIVLIYSRSPLAHACSLLSKQHPMQ